MISSTAHIFVYDTQVYHNLLIEYGSVQLQADLTRLVQWLEAWQMSFTIEKCHNNRQTTYNMGQTELHASSVKKSQHDSGYDMSHFFLSRRGHSATIVQSTGKTPPRIWQLYLASRYRLEVENDVQPTYSLILRMIHMNLG